MSDQKKDKMKAKDIITVTLLSMCSVVIFILLSFLYVVPIFIVGFPVVVSFLQGMVFMMIGIRVPKKGAILLYSIISGIAGMNIIYFAGSVIIGVIGELILAKTGYGKFGPLGITYVLMQIVNAFTSTVYPYVITFDSTKDMIAKTGADISIYETANKMLTGAPVVILLVLTGIAALAGALVGRKMMKKHLLSA
ncbi:MAG: MptD family putative ECF transporter S component [Saccharofermentans sp.]|nr:MptD family putative ECF transporter S component [Saccharofermentans sp.]